MMIEYIITKGNKVLCGFGWKGDVPTPIFRNPNEVIIVSRPVPMRFATKGDAETYVKYLAIEGGDIELRVGV